MSISQTILNDFMRIFTGSKYNYGVHTYIYEGEGEKEKGKNRTVKDKLITVDEYQSHLEGKEGLGIVPLNEENKVLFTVIDLDIYDTDLNSFIDAIESNNFPLVPFLSKSGGLHFYSFFREPVEAELAVGFSRQLASLLGLDFLTKKHANKTIEIFPKQYRLDAGSVGNWINLPYFNASETKTSAIYRGKKINIEDAISLIKDKRYSEVEFEKFLSDLPLQDAPPCLQSLYMLNNLDENSGRNNYLFGFGTYLKKKDENFFDQKLIDINTSMKHPISAEELEGTILKSLKKKDYNYACRTSPMCDFCRKTECKKRDYGVGKDGGFFSTLDYGQMYQYASKQPYYEWEVKLQGDKDYKKLRFRNEDEVINQVSFLKLCVRHLYKLPAKLKQEQWFKLINQALSEIEIIKVEPDFDTSPEILFKALFFEFLLNRAMAENKEQILQRRVFHDNWEKGYSFRTKDLISYLFIDKGFKFFSSTEIHGILRDLGCYTKRYSLKKEKVRVLIYPEDKLKEQGEQGEQDKFVVEYKSTKGDIFDDNIDLNMDEDLNDDFF